MKSHRRYDVFLLSTAVDSATSHVVGDALIEAGLLVFSPVEDNQVGDKESATHDALMDSDALVAVMTRAALHSSNVLFFFGAALGLSKPVFLILDGITAGDLPRFLAGYRTIPMSQFRDVVKLVQAAAQPLGMEQRDSLIYAYSKMGIPADQLASQPSELSRLTNQLNAAIGGNYSGDRVLQELLRMRKQGKLPRLSNSLPRGRSKNRAAG